MSEHVSDFALDQELTHSNSGATAGHVRTCPVCAARLEALRIHRAQLVESNALAPTRRDVMKRAEGQGDNRRRWRWLSLLPLAAAVGFAVWAIAPIRSRPPSERVKGKPFLELLDVDGHSAHDLRQADRVWISLTSAGHPYALLAQVDEHGAVAQVWPPSSAKSGEVSAAGPSRLQPGFEVTRGSFVLFAFLSDKPLRADEVLGALRLSAGSGWCIPPHSSCNLDQLPEPPELPEESARVTTLVRVSDPKDR